MIKVDLLTPATPVLPEIRQNPSTAAVSIHRGYLNSTFFNAREASELLNISIHAIPALYNERYLPSRFYDDVIRRHQPELDSADSYTKAHAIRAVKQEIRAEATPLVSFSELLELIWLGTSEERFRISHTIWWGGMSPEERKLMGGVISRLSSENPVALGDAALRAAAKIGRDNVIVPNIGLLISIADQKVSRLVPYELLGPAIKWIRRPDVAAALRSLESSCIDVPAPALKQLFVSAWDGSRLDADALGIAPSRLRKFRSEVRRSSDELARETLKMPDHF